MIFSHANLAKTLLVLITLTPLSATSQQFFQKYFSSAPGEGYANDVVEIPGGNLIFGGRAQEFNAVKGWLTALTPDGELDWARSYASGNGIEEITALARNDDGEVLQSLVTISPFPQSFLIKTDANGDILWARQLSGTISVAVRDLLTVPGGYLLAGQIELAGPSQHYPAFLMKIDEAGNIIWQKSYRNAFSSLDFRGIAADANDNIYAAGEIDNADGVLARFTASGDLVWMKRAAALNDDNLSNVSVTPDGRVRWSGQAFSFDPSFGVLVLETDTDGNLNWSRAIYLPQASLTHAEMISQPGGEMILTASSYNSLAQNRAHLYSLSADGAQLLWSHELFTGDAGNALLALKTDSNGNLLLGGGTRPSSFFGAWWFLRTDTLGEVHDCCPFPQAPLIVRDTAPQLLEANPVLVSPPLSSLAVSITVQDLLILLETPCPALDTAFTLSDTLICPSECITVQIAQPASGVNYQWTFEGGQPATDTTTHAGPVCYAKAGQFPVGLTVSSAKCSRTVNRTVTVQPEMKPVNAFTPNGDQVNDTFRPYVACNPTNYRLEIYNRWGDKVYEGRDFDARWDGTQDNTPAPSDVYVWVVYYETLVNGISKSLRQSGDVTLLR